MADNIEEAFAALEQLDDKGRRALLLAGVMWEELWREAVARAEKAEWLLERIQKWSGDWGLCFDVGKAAAHWDGGHNRQPPVLVRWYEARITARSEEIRELRVSRECAYDGEKRATAWALRERARAEAAEAECDALMAEIEALPRVGNQGCSRGCRCRVPNKRPWDMTTQVRPRRPCAPDCFLATRLATTE